MHKLLELFYCNLCVSFVLCKMLKIYSQVGLGVLQQGSNTYAECLQYYKQLLSKKNAKHVCAMLQLMLCICMCVVCVCK